MNYTKGEWKVTKNPPCDNWVIATNIDDPMTKNTIALCYDLFPHRDEPTANAHLIAASPMMYEALKRILTEYDKLPDIQPPNFAEAVGFYGKKALAKAEGGE